MRPSANMQNEIYSEAKPNRPPQIVTEIDAGEAAGKTWPIYAMHVRKDLKSNSTGGGIPTPATKVTVFREKTNPSFWA